MRELHTEIAINATAERVWQVLMDFDSYPDWNPYIRKLKGDTAPGAKLEVRMDISGSREMNLKTRVSTAQAGREFGWSGRVLLPGIFDAEHVFIIEPIEEKSVRFVQREQFTGMLAPLILRRMEEGLRQSFNDMNQALKERAES
jgi:hypothetical protein